MIVCSCPQFPTPKLSREEGGSKDAYMLMNSCPSHILDRIKKLLRLGDRKNNAYQYEAEAALAKAHELMTQYKIEVSEFKASVEETQSAMLRTHIHRGLRFSIIDRVCAWILERHFNVRIVSSRSDDGARLVILGMRQDVEYAVYAFGFLNPTIDSLWKAYYRSASENPDRRSFVIGLGWGFIRVLDEAKKKAVQANSAEVQERYAIVVRDHKRAVLEYLYKEFPKLGKGSKLTYGDEKSFQDGTIQGERIQIRSPLPEVAAA
jgi:hypothetical protein